MFQYVRGQTPMDMVGADYELYANPTPFAPVDLHFHDFYEVYISLSDGVDYFIDGRQYSLRRNDVLLICPQELHRPLAFHSDPTEYNRIDLYIRPEYIVSRSIPGVNLLSCFERCGSLPNGNLLRPSERTMGRLLDVIARLSEQGSECSFGHTLLEDAYPMELLVYLNQASLESSDQVEEDAISFNPTVDGMIRYISENLTDDMSLDALAERFFMSKYYLVRIFKRNTGLTPHQFIRYKRLLTARMLLREGRSVTDVCSECGFSDYTHFIRAFRQEFGMPPGKYATSEMLVPANIAQKLV